jgi:hypothetical protein
MRSDLQECRFSRRRIEHVKAEAIRAAGAEKLPYETVGKES